LRHGLITQRQDHLLQGTILERVNHSTEIAQLGGQARKLIHTAFAGGELQR
jgi:hypothetical protein